MAWIFEQWELEEIYRITGENFNFQRDNIGPRIYHNEFGYTAVRSVEKVGTEFVRFFCPVDLSANVRDIILQQVRNMSPFLFVSVCDTNIQLCAGVLLMVNINRITGKTTFVRK